MYKHFLKRLFDIVFSLALLIISSPFIFLTGVYLAFLNKGKVFFLQVRPGLDCKPFTIYKFKTMVDIFDEKGVLLPDEFRITKVGKFIRSTSIDELLQLLNVLKGDMSIVGPRPLLMKYLTRYNQYQRRRQEVKPGITGWAQVNGRNSISWQEKFQYDVEYVENLSFKMDLFIIWLTFLNVVTRKGINSNDNITMEEFKGDN